LTGEAVQPTQKASLSQPLQQQPSHLHKSQEQYVHTNEFDALKASFEAKFDVMNGNMNSMQQRMDKMYSTTQKLVTEAKTNALSDMQTIYGGMEKFADTCENILESALKSVKEAKEQILKPSKEILEKRQKALRILKKRQRKQSEFL